MTARPLRGAGGKRVKSALGSETILFVGGYYEIKNPGAGQQVTKYYFAGASRIAMRKYTIPSSMAVEYLLGDHLGSTSITTNANGAKISEIRYKPWGEIRYSWTSNPSTAPAYKLTSYTFTGQYSIGYINLLWYGSRHYDPELGRFTSADTIVPPGVQGLDRYAYANNSPVMYIDPSGHTTLCGITCEEAFEQPQYSIYDYVALYGVSLDGLSLNEMLMVISEVEDVAAALENEINSAKEAAHQSCVYYSVDNASSCSSPSYLTAAQAFRAVFGEITVKRVSDTCGCWAQHFTIGAGQSEIRIYSSTSTQELLTHPRLIVHEIGHAFYWAAGGYIAGSSIGERNGFYGPHYQWQFGQDSQDDLGTEIFADMFVGWVYGKWERGNLPNGLSINGQAKSAYMDKYMPLMIDKATGR